MLRPGILGLRGCRGGSYHWQKVAKSCRRHLGNYGHPVYSFARLNLYFNVYMTVIKLRDKTR